MRHRSKGGGSKAGRKRKDGDRYPSGDLRPAGPNRRTVEIRRALLGAAPDDKVDLSKAENALDLALERGWLSVARHIAAKRYTRLCRRALVAMPGLKGSRALTDLAPFSPEDGAVSRSGVVTILDEQLKTLATKADKGDITLAEYRRAEKKHRAAHIDWGRMADKEVAAIFDAALSLHEDAVTEADEDSDNTTMRRIWARLTPDESRELFGTCVQDSWPQWVVWRASGKTVPEVWDAKRRRLEHALDVVRAVLTERDGRKLPALPAEARPRSTTPKVIERLDFVDEAGEPVQMTATRTGRPFDVERKVVGRRHEAGGA